MPRGRHAAGAGALFPITPAGRDTLVYGTYEPDASNTGHITDVGDLDEYNSPSTTTVNIPAGAEISGKIIYGDAIPLGAGEAHDCKFVGGTSASPGDVGCLRATNVRSGIFKLYDCTLEPAVEADARNGALGWQFELYRCHLLKGVDGVGIYKTSAPYDCFVKVKGCLIEDLVYIYPDRYHTDGTHNDGIQIQGGRHIEIVGNSIRGTGHERAGTGENPVDPWLLTDPNGPWCAGSGIIIQKNIAGAPNFDSTVIIDSNYFRACKQQLTIKSTALGPWVCTNNKFSVVDGPAFNSDPPPSYNPTWIRYDNLAAHTPITGLSSGGVVTNTTNKFLDGPSAGVALTTPRANGIYPTG
jgi:hypothetical protein